jgi:hypothetical protein
MEREENLYRLLGGMPRPNWRRGGIEGMHSHGS